MAVTGLILILFLLMHMFGNLKLLASNEDFNRYAGFLRTILNPILPGESFLWIFRIFMLLAIVLHIWSAIRVNKQRNIGTGGAGRYSVKKNLSPENTYAARTMFWGGWIIFLFLILHLLQFTISPDLLNNPPTDAAGRADGTYCLQPLVVRAHLPHRHGRGVHARLPRLLECLCDSRRQRLWYRSRCAARVFLDRRHRDLRGLHDSSLPDPVRGDLLMTATAASNNNAALADQYWTTGDEIHDTKANHDLPIEKIWTDRQFTSRLVNPANRRKMTVIIVGTGLAGGAAAATLGEAGYRVENFCYQDSPRRAHSIAAQGGINAAKNYKNDGDSIYRLFYDTVKGGDYRSRETNVYRLAAVSANIIDQCVAQGVPFAREYGGLLDNRSFGGVQVQRTFYARGQTGQQLLIGAYQALERQVHAGTVHMHTRHEMVELIVIDGRARGIVTRDMVTGKIEEWFGDAVVLATGGYGNVFFLSTNAMGCNATASWRAHRKGAYFGNPCYTQIHPTCIPVHGENQSKLTLMSESLRNDGRIWVPKRAEDCEKDPRDIPEEDRDYYLERIYPSFGNLVPRDIASRQAKYRCDEGRGVGPKVREVDSDGTEHMRARGVYLDFSEAIQRMGKDAVEKKYGNLFDMYQRITDENPYEVPMRIYPAVHYTMGGLWVDYDLQSTIPGLFVCGEANFSDHGANRLGASA
ncbi:succinate dehydrogenase flavoprotein subunit [Cutibacterium acnes JCM 18909]|nr:succinate dehydrogenase flavoprotein subunit [Cutibacterium acnes JCM 18909]